MASALRGSLEGKAVVEKLLYQQLEEVRCAHEGVSRPGESFRI